MVKIDIHKLSTILSEMDNNINPEIRFRLEMQKLSEIIRTSPMLKKMETDKEQEVK